MLEKFDEDARDAMVLAEEEALNLRANSVGAEHILLALVSLGKGVAWLALHRCGVQQKELRVEVGNISSSETKLVPTELSFTEEAKSVLISSHDHAARLGQESINSGHLLLGILGEHEAINSNSALEILKKLDVDIHELKEHVFDTIRIDFERVSQAHSDLDRPLDTIPNWYQVLQVAPDADRQMIRLAFRYLTEKYGALSTDADAEKYNLVLRAWSFLSSDDRRNEYDQFLRNRTTD